MASTVLKLALMSKDADNIVKGCRHWESKTMNNEVEIEELDKNLREAKRIGKHHFFCLPLPYQLNHACSVFG